MSNIAMAGGSTGTGTVTLLAPSTSTNRTINLPDSNGTMATAESTLTQFNASGSAPVYACRAWVNFNGTGTVAINASGNVSSITDNGVGNYSINFTTAMSDANYAVCATARNGAVSDSLIAASEQSQNTAALAKIFTTNDVGILADARGVSVSIFR